VLCTHQQPQNYFSDELLSYPDQRYPLSSH
jgi:hypothetical protein